MARASEHSLFACNSIPTQTLGTEWKNLKWHNYLVPLENVVLDFGTVVTGSLHTNQTHLSSDQSISIPLTWPQTSQTRTEKNKPKKKHYQTVVNHTLNSVKLLLTHQVHPGVETILWMLLSACFCFKALGLTQIQWLLQCHFFLNQLTHHSKHKGYYIRDRYANIFGLKCSEIKPWTIL